MSRDNSKMRRAGRPSVDVTRGAAFAEKAYAEGEFKNTLRTQGNAHYDAKPIVGRVIHQLRTAVESLSKENASQAKLEEESAQTFQFLCTQVTALQRAFTTLADAVIEELDTVRDDQVQWRQEKEEWVHKMTSIERDVERRVAAVDSWREENDALRGELLAFKTEQAGVNSSQVNVETMRDHLEDLRAEMGYAQSAVSEARLALAEAERREAEMGQALQSLQLKAEGADLQLQDQINAVRSAVESKLLGGGGGGISGSGSAATESDVVALRDWTKAVTTGHDARLRRMETGLSAMAMSERGAGGSVGGGSGGGGGGGGGWGSRGPSRGGALHVGIKLTHNP
jgi:hypothetical protein